MSTDQSDNLIEPESQPTEDPLPIGRAIYEDLSGTAGTGKTTLSRRLATEAAGVELCATTGIAAVNLGEGTTINALLKYYNTADLVTKYTQGVVQSVLRKLQRTGLRRILLDEKSMLNGQQLTVIARAIREINENQAAEGVGEDVDDESSHARRQDFPPIGLTLVGDFGQLPPVPDEDEATGKKIPVQFAFDSPEWPAFAAHRTVLTKIWRQDAQDFIQALHAVRRGDAVAALNFFTPNRFHATQDDQFEGSTIFAKNESVDRYNALRLDSLTGKAITFETVRKGKPRGDWKLIPERLALKEGALVMLLANHRVYESEFDSRGRIIYANGDLGTLLGPAENQGGWFVTLHRNQQQVVVYPIIRENVVPLEVGRRKELRQIVAGRLGAGSWEDCEPIDAQNLLREYITEDGKHEILGSIFYMPMRAAYGATVHKTQGLTLDKVQININDYFFRHPGMLFVALSRCRTAGGLRIVGSQRGFLERCKTEPRVQGWL